MSDKDQDLEQSDPVLVAHVAECAIYRKVIVTWLKILTILIVGDMVFDIVANYDLFREVAVPGISATVPEVLD